MADWNDLYRQGEKHRNSRKKIKTITCGLFELLPNELVAQIFSFLDFPHLSLMWSLCNRRLEDVCNYIRYRKCGPCIVTDKEWSLETFQDMIVMAAPYIMHLILYTKYVDDLLVIKVLKECKVLWDIIFPFGAFSPAVMVAIGSKDSLRGIMLNKGGVNNNEVRPVSTAALVLNAIFLRNLRYIGMSEAEVDDEKDEKWIRAIVENCQGLVALSLPRSVELKDELFSYILDRLQGTLRKIDVCSKVLTDASFTNLKNCRLLSGVYLHSAVHIGGEGLSAIGELHSQLQRLTISGATFTVQDFEKAFSGKLMPNLSCLNLWNSVGIGDDIIEIIAINSPSLRSFVVDITKISDRGLDLIRHHCKKNEEAWEANAR